MSSYEWISELEDGEEAKPIRGFPGHFITNKGRVRGLTKWRTPRLRQQTDRCKNPYTYEIKLKTEEGLHTTTIHRLVGTHFIDGYVEGNILHKDETLPFPIINYPDNLFIGSQKDNNLDKFQKGRHQNVRDDKGRFTNS